MQDHFGEVFRGLVDGGKFRQGLVSGWVVGEKFSKNLGVAAKAHATDLAGAVLGGFLFRSAIAKFTWIESATDTTGNVGCLHFFLIVHGPNLVSHWPSV